MIGNDHDGIVLVEILEWRVDHVQGVVTSVANCGEVWVVVEDLGALFAKQLDDGERRRLAQIVDVALIGQAQDENLRSIDGLAVAV
jgi:hypothetical protein